MSNQETEGERKWQNESQTEWKIKIVKWKRQAREKRGTEKSWEKLKRGRVEKAMMPETILNLWEIRNPQMATLKTKNIYKESKHLRGPFSTCLSAGTWSTHVAHPPLSKLPLNMLRVRANKLTTLLLLWGFRCFKDLILQCKCWSENGLCSPPIYTWGMRGGGANIARLHPSSSSSAQFR